MSTEQYSPGQELLDQLVKVSNNPGLAIEMVYGNLVGLTEGKINIPNPTNPFSYLVETAAMMAYTLHQSHDTTYREQYPLLATEYKHLYNHMFDEHYVGRFAMPGTATFHIHFKKDEIFHQLNRNLHNGVRKIIIPRGSYINVMDYTFTLLYAVEIVQLAHGGIHVLYRTDHADPVHVLNSNIVKWDYVAIADVEYIRLELKLYNVKLSQKMDNLTVHPGYHEKWTLDERFVHCRVYQTKNGKVEELTTTHSDLIYDASKCTAKLTYLDNELSVEIPSIYANNGLMGERLFVEIYTTAGKVEEAINQYGNDSFNYQWGKLENLLDDSNYVTPLELLTSPIVIARTMLSGGTNSETFKQTRDRVINYAGHAKTPITPNQLETGMRIKGYDILKSRDVVTQRTYLATRALPLDKNDIFTAGAASSMETIRVSIEELQTHPAVRDNERRVTITPEMLYKTDNGVVRLVYPIDNPKLNRSKYGPEDYISEINKLQYMFSPFYYVVDPTSDTFNMRAYYMDKPATYDQMFIANNETSGMSVSSDDIYIAKFEDTVGGKFIEGYKVRVKLTVTEAYTKVDPDKLWAQLSIIPTGDNNLASINGVLLGTSTNPETKLKEYIWEFTLKTDWDLPENHSLILKDFYMYINEGRRFEFGLSGEFFFTYGIRNMHIPGYRAGEVDKYINRVALGNDELVGITVDKVKYRLGWHLNHFWANGIPVQSSIAYERYSTDVPRVYTRDVYEIDNNGKYIVENDALKIKHRAGDPVLDERGQPVLMYRAGDVKLDANGEPKVLQTRQLTRLLDIMMVDGVYYFADNENDINYRKAIGETVKNYVVDDLDDISDRLLERTELFFYPKRTMGDAKLLIDNGTEIQEPMRMSFTVTYYMTDSKYTNMDIRAAITSATKKIINKQLEEINVSISSIVSALREAGGEDIIAVHMDRFGSREDRRFTTYTSKDSSVRCSVKRLVESLADGTIKVIEDIKVNFVKHDTILELRE